MTSLTPQRDAVEKAIAIMSESYAKASPAPDARAALARKITFEVNCIVMRGMADARDRGVEPSDCGLAVAWGLGNTVASVAGTLAGGQVEGSMLIMNHLVAAQADAAARAIIAVATGADPHGTTVKVDASAKAQGGVQ